MSDFTDCPMCASPTILVNDLLGCHWRCPKCGEEFYSPGQLQDALKRKEPKPCE